MDRQNSRNPRSRCSRITKTRCVTRASRQSQINACCTGTTKACRMNAFVRVEPRLNPIQRNSKMISNSVEIRSKHSTGLGGLLLVFLRALPAVLKLLPKTLNPLLPNAQTHDDPFQIRSFQSARPNVISNLRLLEFLWRIFCHSSSSATSLLLLAKLPE
jgi:hypothetical protein